MKKQLQSISTRVFRVIRSDRFFYVTVGLFGLASAWVATASLYPMAFDEEFHFGLIKIYSSHLTPYTLEPTRDMAQYGLVSADVSYLFHYLMSFPYRVINALQVSEQVTIVLLRFINIGFVLWALFIYRKILHELGVSKAISHVTIAFFTLIPIMPLLAGQINYDNLLLVIIGWSMLLAVRVDKKLREKGKIDVWPLAWLFILVLFGSNVKYAFLPIGAMLILWIVGHIVYRYKRSARRIGLDLQKGWKATEKSQKQLLVGLAILGILLSGRFATNLIEYGQFIPRCQAVFDYEACKAYGPWVRNERMHAKLDDNFSPKSLPEYVVIDWIPGMVRRLFFAIAGPTNSYANSNPLLAPLITYILLAVIGLVAFLSRIRSTFKAHPALLIVSAVTIAYIGSLVYKLYGVYLYTGGPVAINGRYLLPFIPLIIAVLGTSFIGVLRKQLMPTFAALVSLFLAIVVTQGGGVGTYILQGESAWFWPGWGMSTHALLQSVVSLIIV
ncbi:TPA: hypothetical protein DIV49_01465 [Candidatus Saccharibacteria bacterium]|nr:hypothetical protein [Candidatus Saccharibacteria bacterium]HRJ90604.1 hypothetical protein [Candidatus Saccharibacteria bacterium]